MRKPCAWVVACLLSTVAVPNVEAQEVASSFDQLRALLKPGDEILVSIGAGPETRGVVAAVSPSSLELIEEGSRRSFLESDTRTIWQRRTDSLKNGTLIGLVIGAAFGAVSFLDVQDSGDVGLAAGATLVMAGLGAAVGMGTDAAVRRTEVHVVFARPIRTSARLSVSPLLTRDRKGALVSLGF